MQPTTWIWQNGELVPWQEAQVHIGSHGLHIGSGVFEGIRCYDTADGPAVFRLDEHLRRFERSARLLYMDLPYSSTELRQAVHGLIRANELRSCYLRLIAFYGGGSLGVLPTDCPVEVGLIAVHLGAYLGEEGLQQGIRAKISSYQRVGPNVIPHTAKATGVYLNSMLACLEARRAGYDEAILLTGDGYVADGPGENIFLVHDRVVLTPPLSTSILPGVTRASLIEIARRAGYRVEERSLIRSDLYLADEVLMSGTAAEVTPVRSVDDIEIGVGPITRDLQRRFFAVVRGNDPELADWLDVVAPANSD